VLCSLNVYFRSARRNWNSLLQLTTSLLGMAVGLTPLGWFQLGHLSWAARPPVESKLSTDIASLIRKNTHSGWPLVNIVRRVLKLDILVVVSRASHHLLESTQRTMCSLLKQILHRVHRRRPIRGGNSAHYDPIAHDTTDDDITGHKRRRLGIGRV